jgi:ATP phosphoribosyltransferase
VLHKDLGYGRCRLCVAVPEEWEARTIADVAARASTLGHTLRVATKFPVVTKEFFARHGLPDPRLILPEGTLEVAPHIGYADIIVDLVSSGRTLRENRLSVLEDGEILASQACLFANREALVARPAALGVAKHLIEFIEAHLRARDNYTVFANMRGESPEAIGARMAEQTVIGGLQGPTISRVVHPEHQGWYAVHVVVRRDRLPQAIAELRSIGGSGVVVTPVTYIFEEEPETYREMLAALEDLK